MRADEIWKVFAETGEPVYYLLYKAIGAEKNNDDRHAHGLAAG